MAEENLNPIPLPVTAPINTAEPDTNRPPGTVVAATDANHDSWGPRRRLTQQTWPYQSAAYYPNPRTPAFNGTTSQMVAVMGAKEQYNLGTKWTADLIFRPDTVSHSADALLPIWTWNLANVAASSTIAFQLAIKGGGAAANDQRKIVATVNATSSAGTFDATATLTGTTQVSVGTNDANVHALRLIRDGADLSLYVDGVLEASSSSFSATERHEGEPSVANMGLNNTYFAAGTLGGNHLFNGRIYQSLLRSGAFTDVTQSIRSFSFAKTVGVHFHQYGAPLGIGNTSALYELSLFRTPLTYNTVTYANVTAPKPWNCTPVQAGTHWVDIYGRAWSVVMTGGTLFWRRVA